MSHSPWNQPLPPTLTLGGIKGFNDPLAYPTQSWGISGGGSPSLGIRSQNDDLPGEIILQTSYWEGFQQSSLPQNFPLPPILDHMSWDWLSYHCQPLPNLETEVVNWVPDPRVICGVHHFQNSSAQSRDVILKLTCLDKLGLLGTRFYQESYQGRRILCGSSNYMNLALFTSGSQSPSSGPANQLSAPISLKPSEKAEIRWILILCDTNLDARTYLEEVIKLDWPGEIARRKVSLANQLQIKTGNPDWDFSLACSQRQAQVILNQLFLQAQKPQSPLPDINAFQVWQLTQALTPMDNSDLDWLLKNAFSVGPGPGPDFPLQVELLSQAWEAGLDQDLVIGLLSNAEKNLTSWFSRSNDKDQDGIPENPERDIFQIGQYQQKSGGEQDHWQVKDSLESPALAALLHNELRQFKIAQNKIPGASPRVDLDEQIKILADFILSSWSDSEERFRSRDFQTNSSEEGYTLPQTITDGWNLLRCELPYPSRLFLQLTGSPAKHFPPDLEVTLQGLDWQDRYRIEVLTSQEIVWQGKGCRGITKSIFKRLDHCIVKGVGKNQKFHIKALESDWQDLSLTLPLWMEDLPPELIQKMVNRSLSDPTRFWSEFGLKTHPQIENSPVQLPLNTLVVGGLVKNGNGALAADLFKGWMEAISLNLKRTGSLYAAWDANTGRGLGQENNIESLLPIGLLLDLLGIQFNRSSDVVLERRTPDFFPVKLNYKGTEMVLQEGETLIHHPGRIPKTQSRNETVILQL